MNSCVLFVVLIRINSSGVCLGPWGNLVPSG